MDMKLNDLLRFLDTRTTGGASLDELKNHFDEVETEDIQRICHAAIDLGDVKTDGKGRGLRYYGIKYDVVKITNGNYCQKANDSNFIDGIDVRDCLNTKEKVRKILDSPQALSKPISLSYRERLFDDTTNRELKDFIKDGVKDVDVRLYYSPKEKKNVIYSKQERVKHNSLWIGIVDNKYVIRKHFNDSQDQPEIKQFERYEDFEKCVRTLMTK